MPADLSDSARGQECPMRPVRSVRIGSSPQRAEGGSHHVAASDPLMAWDRFIGSHGVRLSGGARHPFNAPGCSAPKPYRPS